MKKKKIILGGLLGISVLAAGITLASCSVIPLTPYEPTTTAPSTPAPSSSSQAPAASSSNVTPAASSSDTPAPSSSSEAPVASSSESPAVSNEVSFDATKLTTGDTYVADTTEDTTEEKAEVTAAELCNGFFTQVIEGEGKIVKRSKQYKVGDVKHYSSECVAIEASAGCGLEFTVTHAVKLTLSLQSTSSSNKSIFVLQKNDVSVAASNAADLTENETANHYVITGASVAVEYELEAGTYEMLYLNEKAAASDSATVNRGGRFFAITTEEIEITPVVQKYSVTYVSTYGIKPADFVDATELTANDLPTLEDANYDFGGWYTDESLQTPAVAGELTANVTLYAKWTIKATVQTVDVTFVFDNGTENNVVAVAEGTKVTKPTDPTKTGYAFDGWFLENATEPFDFDTAINEATTLTARYHQVFTITFENAQGDAPEAITGVTKITVADLPTLSKDYYVFKGWAVSGSTEIITADTDITDNVVLVAQWDAIPTYAILKAADLDPNNEQAIQIIDPHDYIFGDKVIPDATKPNEGYYESFVPYWKDRDFLSTAYQNTGANSGKTTTAEKNRVRIVEDDSTSYFYLYDDGVDKVGDNEIKGSTVLNLDTRYSKGVIEAVFDIKVENGGSSWTPIQLIGSTEGKEIFGIRTDTTDKKTYIKYRVGGTVTAGLTNIELTDTTYTFYMKADLDNNKLTIYINGKPFVVDLQLEDLALDYILFTSSNGGNKTLSVGNIALRAQISDEDFIANFKEKVDLFAARYKKAIPDSDPVAYYYDQDEVDSYVNAIKTSLDHATSGEQAAMMFGSGIMQFRMIDTLAVKAAKAEITSYIENYTFDMLNSYDLSYTFEGTDIVVSDVESFTDGYVHDALAASTDLQATVTDIKAKYDEIQDASPKIIKAYKDALLSILNVKYASSDYTIDAPSPYGNKQDYDKAFDDLELALASLTAKSDIDNEVAATDTILLSIHTDDVIVADCKEDASEYIDTYKADEISQLDTTDATIAAIVADIEEAIEAAKDDVDAATTIDGINSIVTNFAAEIDGYLAEAAGDIESLRSSRAAALESYKTKAKSDYSLSAVDDKDLIDAIDAVVITNLDNLDTIAAINAGLADAQLEIDKLVNVDAITKHINSQASSLTAWVTSAEYQTAIAETLTNCIAAIQNATVESTMSTIYSAQETAVATAIETIKSNNQFNVSIVSSNTANGTVSAEKVVTPKYAEITVNDNVITINGTEVTATATENTDDNVYNFVQWSDVPTTALNDNVTITAVFNVVLRPKSVTIGAKSGSVTSSTNITNYLTVPGSSTVSYTYGEGSYGLYLFGQDSNGEITYTEQFVGNSDNKNNCIKIGTVTTDSKYYILNMDQSEFGTNDYLIQILIKGGSGRYVRFTDDTAQLTNEASNIGETTSGLSAIETTVTAGKKYYFGSSSNQLDLYAINIIPIMNVSVSLEKNDGSSVETVSMNRYSQIAPAAPTKTGYEFAGWYTDSSLADNSKFMFIDDNMTLYAKWTYTDYTITYDLAGGELETNVTNPTKYTINADTFTLNNPIKTGYEFAGWTYEGQTTPQTTVSIEKGSTGNKVFTANWTVKNYTITYENLTDSETMTAAENNNPATYTIETATFNLAPLTDSNGHYFVNWEDENGDPITSIALGSYGDRVLTAVWSNVVTYTLSYDLAGGELEANVTNPTSYNNATDTFTLNNPIKTGYEFAGWTYEGQTTPVPTVTISKGSEGNKSFTANWNVKVYKIMSYSGLVTVDEEHKDSNTNPDEQTFSIETTYTLLPATTTREKMVFVGWYTDSEFTNKITSTQGIYSDITTLYAKWAEEIINYEMPSSKLSSGTHDLVSIETNVVLKYISDGNDAIGTASFDNNSYNTITFNGASNKSARRFIIDLSSYESTDTFTLSLIIGVKNGAKVYVLDSDNIGDTTKDSTYKSPAEGKYYLSFTASDSVQKVSSGNSSLVGGKTYYITCSDKIPLALINLVKN